jgi:hypothetical protein
VEGRFIRFSQQLELRSATPRGAVLNAERRDLISGETKHLSESRAEPLVAASGRVSFCSCLRLTSRAPRTVMDMHAVAVAVGLAEGGAGAFHLAFHSNYSRAIPPIYE